MYGVCMLCDELLADEFLVRMNEEKAEEDDDYFTEQRSDIGPVP